MDPIVTRDLLLTPLIRRDRAGEPPVAEQELREMAGLGPGDFETTLAILVDEGSVRLAASGGYELGVSEEQLAAGGPRVVDTGASENGGDPLAAESAAEEPPELVARRFLITEGFDVSALNDLDVMRKAGEVVEQRHAAQQAAAAAPKWTAGPGDRRIELTAATAAAIDGATLGGMVAAGIEEARVSGSRFVLVVEP